MSDIKIKNNGEDLDTSLIEIADIDLSEVEVSFGGFSTTPESIALWRIINMEVKSFGEHTVVQIENECEKCYAVKGDEYTADSLIGFKHNESIFLKDLTLDIGKVKGFLSVIGMSGITKLNEAMQAAVGMKYVAAIKHSRNKDDPDKPWVNMDIKGIQLQEVFEAGN